MAKKSVVNRNNQREKLIARYQKQRTALRDTVKSASASLEEKLQAQASLQTLPRDSAQCRYKVRCQISGRSRGVYRKFSLSRIMLRQMAHEGFVPGMTKASW